MMPAAPPDPRRRRPWKRIVAAAIAGLTLSAILAQAIWTSHERAAVVRRVAAIRAAGEPMDVADFKSKSVRPEDDAAILIRAAVAAEAKDPDRERRIDDIERDDPYAFSVPLDGEPLALWRRMLADNAAALKAIESVDTRHRADWGIAVTSPTILILLPELTGAREIVDLLRADALVAHHDGNGDRAIESVIDIDAIGSHVYDDVSLVSALVGLSGFSVAANAASTIAPDLPFSPNERPRVLDLIARMNDDSLPRTIVVNGLRDERFGQLDMVDSLFVGGDPAGKLLAGQSGPAIPTNPVVRFVARPFLYRIECESIDLMNECIRLTAAATNLAAFNAQRGSLDALSKPAESGPYAGLLMNATYTISRVPTTYFRCLTDRHLAAAALAVRLYAIDHDGGLPPTLDALVPEYLSSVPTDAIDGRPLRYDAAGKILWSVGANGIDDGGDGTAPRPTAYDERWSSPDAVVALSRMPKPSTQATRSVTTTAPN